MTFTQKLEKLIKLLLEEMPEYKIRDKECPTGISRFYFYRTLVNMREPKAAGEQYLEIEDAFLQECAQDKGIVDVNSLIPVSNGIYLWQGDITALQCDAVVNDAQPELLGCFTPCHKCVDNAVHTFAGIRLRLECDRIINAQGHSEAVGGAVITDGYNLPCKYIIHTVGPKIIGEVTDKQRSELKSCYLSCLELAQKNDLKSIAFCCIDTGKNNFPNEEAAKIAYETVKEFQKQTDSTIKVIFDTYSQRDYELYAKILGEE